MADPADPLPDADALFEGRISASWLYQLQKCERRVYLLAHAPTEKAPPSDLDRMLFERGREHERKVCQSFSGLVGPIWRFGQPLEPAVTETFRHLHETRSPLYQPAFLSADRRRAGVPDFLYWEDDRPVLHDAKLAVDLGRHPEIRLQLTHYAALLRESTGLTAAHLRITNGRDEVVEVPPLDDERYRDEVERAAELLAGGPEPDLLKPHSTCEDCPFYAHCWPRAVAERRIEVLSDVNTKIALLLHGRGVHTFDDLAAMTPDQIRMPGIVGMAEKIVAEARAHRDNDAVWLGIPDLPPHPLVWLDLEGDPDSEEADKAIYLWGLAVDDGVREPEPEAIVAEFEPLGGRRAWEQFVARALEILQRFPAARWVHYHAYERTWIKEYVQRFGAPAGFAERMEAALFDMYYKVVKAALRLPLRSYSIKQVAPWMGFQWSNPESGSAWSIVQYQRAREATAVDERQRILSEIIRYNQDDLRAMRAVWRWTKAHAPHATGRSG